MTKIIISAILFLILPIQVWSEDELRGSFTCKINYQKTIAHAEGITKDYDSGLFIGHIDYLGESFDINYLYEKNEVDTYFHIFETEKLLINSWGNNDIAYSVKAKGTNKWPRPFVKFYGDYQEWMIFKEDEVEIRSQRFGINLIRYYKNDWSGLYYASRNLRSVFVYGLDCRHKIDKFDEIASDLRKKGWME